MSTQFPSGNQIQRDWYLIDAENAVLGRLASQAARMLMGKHKPSYTPFLDPGDHGVINTAAKARLTGKQEEQKIYRHHTGHPGGVREVAASKMRAKSPVKMVESAVAGMLPKTKLGKHMIKKLKVYAGSQHRQQAQKPVPIPAAGR
jgi:large subunit ribosomal protein L13